MTASTSLPGDDLHRLAKLFMDSGEAQTQAKAEQMIRSYRLAIGVGPEVAHSPTLQAGVLTAVNTAARTFLGGVEVWGVEDTRLLVPWKRCNTLAEAVSDLGGRIVTAVPLALPLVVFGDVPRAAVAEREFALQATFNGWAGGVLPLGDSHRLREHDEFVPSGVLAGALGVSEAFQHVRGGYPLPGRRDMGLSLWKPDAEVDWRTADAGPPLEVLPARLWMIGLGHLGQAILWTLGLLPYGEPGEVELVLQDFDRLVTANESTSVLTTSAIVGQPKTRAMAQWADARGFKSRICERLFRPNFKIADDEPSVGVCGVDNALARAALEDVGFKRVIEAGLGKGTTEYLALQVHTFPAAKRASSIWGSATAGDDESVLDRPAYKALADAGVDGCGLTQLAGRTVGASFVGAVTSSLVVAEMLRMSGGYHSYEVVDATLRSLINRRAVPSQTVRDPFNPGITAVSGANR